MERSRWEFWVYPVALSLAIGVAALVYLNHRQLLGLVQSGVGERFDDFLTNPFDPLSDGQMAAVKVAVAVWAGALLAVPTALFLLWGGQILVSWVIQANRTPWPQIGPRVRNVVTVIFVPVIMLLLILVK